MQREECEEGMPPESTTARMSHTPCLNFFVKICTHAYHPYCNSTSSEHVGVTWRRPPLVGLKPWGRLQVSGMTWSAHMCLWVRKGKAHKACQFHDPSVHGSCLFHEMRALLELRRDLQLLSVGMYLQSLCSEPSPESSLEDIIPGEEIESTFAIELRHHQNSRV